MSFTLHCYLGMSTLSDQNSTRSNELSSTDLSFTLLENLWVNITVHPLLWNSLPPLGGPRSYTRFSHKLYTTIKKVSVLRVCTFYPFRIEWQYGLLGDRFNNEGQGNLIPRLRDLQNRRFLIYEGVPCILIKVTRLSTRTVGRWNSRVRSPYCPVYSFPIINFFN